MSDTANPAHVERDLDETRSRLDTHLSQLQDRLSPGQVLDDLMAYFRGSEGAAFGRNLMDNVRDNPLPAALTGIGLAWLMASNPRPGATTSHSGKVRVHLHHYGREDYDTTMMRVREAEQGVQRQSDESDYAYSTRVDAARGQAIGLARHAQETAGSFGQRVRDALSAAQQSVSETAQNARDQAANAMNTAAGAVGSIGSSAQGTAQGAARYAGGALSSGGQMSSNMVAAISESPVLLGALGLAAGAMLGALIPQSEQEQAALGGIAGQTRDAATNLAREGIERGKHVAQAVADKAQESAQNHDLAGGRSAGQMVDAALSGELADNAKAALHDVLESGDKAIRKETASSGNKPSATGSSRPSNTP